METVGANAHWHWFVEDIRNYCLIHTQLTLKSAVKGHYDRRVAYSRVNILDILCDQVR